MTLSNSWKLTLVVYAVSLSLIVLEVFTGINISETQYNFLLGIMGLTTIAGTSNAVLSNKEKIKQLIIELKQGTKDNSDFK